MQGQKWNWIAQSINFVQIKFWLNPVIEPNLFQIDCDYAGLILKHNHHHHRLLERCCL